MRTTRLALPLFLAAGAALGCATTTPSATPAVGAPTSVTATERAPRAADLSGVWDFTVDVGDRATAGEFSLERRGDAFAGTLRAAGPNTLVVRPFTPADGAVRMIVDTPEGVVTFDGALAPDARSMRGTVTYHAGQRYPMEARRRG